MAQHPIDGIDPSSATQQLGVPGPWHERLPHFRLEFQPSAGEELQSEYLRADDATRSPAGGRCSGCATLIRGPLLTVEIRCVAGDSMWLSPTAGQDCIAFHFTWAPDIERVRPVLDAVEAVLLPLRCSAALGQGLHHAGRGVRARSTRGCRTSGGWWRGTTRPASSATTWSTVG